MYSPSAPEQQTLAPHEQALALHAHAHVASREETPLLININENIIEKNIIEKNNNNKKEEEDKNSCIICLEEKNEDNSNKSIISINELPFLNKSCSCHFFIHEKCFNLWFFKKPVCPICTLPLNYLEIIQISNNTDDRTEYIRFLKNITYLFFYISFLYFISFFFYSNFK